MAAVRLSHKRVFLGEGIMIEVIWPAATIQLMSALVAVGTWRRYWQIA
jgi:hypothetical protein